MVEQQEGDTPVARCPFLILANVQAKGNDDQREFHTAPVSSL